MRVFVFPGQGSQSKGMGADLFDSVKQFAAVEDQVNNIVGYSLRDMCLNDSEGLLDQTRCTQPCLYVVNALHYYKAVEEGQQPGAVAGHSLGEYNALLAAGVFDFLTGLKLVQKRGELMSKASTGSMAAIVGLEAEQVADIIKDQEFDGIDVANFNSPHQTVISGVPEQIQRAITVFKDAGAKMAVPLKVSGAFHSRYMIDAAKEFDLFLRQFEFTAPKITVVANVTAQPYAQDKPNDNIRHILVQQIYSSVRWTDSIRYLLSEGATEFDEIGPGKVLTKLINQICK